LQLALPPQAPQSQAPQTEQASPQQLKTAVARTFDMTELLKDEIGMNWESTAYPST
jgi:hypothetical protein